MEALSGAIRGGAAGCSPVCLEHNRKASAGSRRRSLFVGQQSRPCSRMRDLAMPHRTSASPRDYPARAHRHQSFADLSHAAFYGEEESTTTGRKASDKHQQITLEYADDEDLKRQLGILRLKLKRKGGKPSKHFAESSSSSSSSDSSDSEAEADRRSLRRQRSKSARDVSVNALPVSEDRKFAAPRPATTLPLLEDKEEGRQRSKAARDVSVHALPVLEERKIAAPVSTLPLLDDRVGSPLDGYRVEARVLDPELQSSTSELQRLFNLPARVSGDVAAPPLDTVATPKARVEVCMGGKCKKMGAEKLLCAFQNNLSGCASVEAVSCKCLKRCQHGVNVRFSQEGVEDRDVQSRVDIQDVPELLRQRFPEGATSPTTKQLDCGASIFE